jgi:uncharacterized integral membrane protein (TIGR00698 family)
MRDRTPSRGNPYENPELLRWLDSYEGLPPILDPAESAEEVARREAWGERAHRLFGMAGTVLPGVALAGALALLGERLAEWLGTSALGFEKSPVSGILVAILLGLAIRHGIGLPAVYEAGLRLCVRRVLRVGVALLGIRLSLGAAGAIGLVAVPIVVGCIAAALVAVSWINRALGLPRRLGTLIAVGTAICGNTAIIATAPVIGAKDDETSYAVGCVTLFGLLALLVHPHVAHGLFGGDATLVGLFLGTAIHDTAQVAGAGLLYAQQYGEAAALDVATVTKLVRNLFMLGVIPLAAWLHHRGRAQPWRTHTPFSQIVPFFVFGFVAMTALRTLGDLGERPFGLLDAAAWQDWIATLSSGAHACLALAMAAVGLGTSFTKLRVLGVRPLAVGMAAALLVGLVGFVLIRASEALRSAL